MVRKFESRDAQAVEEILRKSPEAAAWSRKSLEQLNGRGELAWVIEIAGEVVGFLVARAVVAEAEILNLSIDPERRRAGNATALLQEGITEFRRLHVRKIFLEVRESNLSAISFYERNAFVRNGLRPAYYQSPPETAVLMMRELTG
jgi:[ribosomal protein S18]-alanine N-acetyltransferase